MPSSRVNFALFLVSSLSSLVPSLGYASPYDSKVLADLPVLYLTLGAPHGSHVEHDLSTSHHGGTYFSGSNSIQKTQMPNGDAASVFNGANQYLEVSSRDNLSLQHNKALSLEAWIRPDTLQFPNSEGDGYVHWAGKGESSEYEYVCRMYSLNNSANRPNRISGYAFNPDGGLGSGSYFQDALVAGAWIHVGVVIDNRNAFQQVRIFKNGVLRKTTMLNQFDVVPQPGNAPLRIGTRDMRSFFKGAIGKFAIYNYAVSEAQFKNHFLSMH